MNMKPLIFWYVGIGDTLAQRIQYLDSIHLSFSEASSRADNINNGFKQSNLQHMLCAHTLSYEMHVNNLSLVTWLADNNIVNNLLDVAKNSIQESGS